MTFRATERDECVKKWTLLQTRYGREMTNEARVIKKKTLL